MGARIGNILLGIWLMVLPSIFETGPSLANNNFIVGPLVITMAVVAIWEVNRSVRRVNTLLGAWQLLAAFIFPAPAQWLTLLQALAGLLIVLLSFIKGRTKSNYGGGWRFLFTG